MKFPFSLIFLFVFFLVSCGRRPIEEINPAPSSTLTVQDAINFSKRVTINNPHLVVFKTAPTGSMLPFLDSRTVVICEVYTGQPINVGDIVVFNREDSPNIIHRIIEVKGDSVFISGDNNKYSDGWFNKSSIKYRLVGLFYTERK